MKLNNHRGRRSHNKVSVGEPAEGCNDVVFLSVLVMNGRRFHGPQTRQVEGGMLKLMAAPVVGTGGYFLLAWST